MNELARRSGVSASTISRWESGKSFPCVPELEAALNILHPKDFIRRRIFLSIDAPRTIQKLQNELQLSRTVGSGVMPTSGGFLKALRQRASMTQADVATRMGISQSTLARWEKGDHWPSTRELHSLCLVIGAREGEVIALTTNPKSLAPDHTGKALSFEEAQNWAFRVTWSSIDQEEPALIELHYWQLLAGVWGKYTKWGEAGLELFGLVLARMAYMYLDAKPGMSTLPDTARKDRAKYFAEQALSLPLAANSESSLLSMIVLSQVLAESPSPSDLLHAHDLILPWTTKKVSHRSHPGSDEIHPASAGWALARLSSLMERRGWLTAADSLSIQAIRVVNSFGLTIETRMRTNDRAELLIRLGRYPEAQEVLQKDTVKGNVISYWESVLWADVLSLQGKYDEALQKISHIQPGLATKDEDYFLSRAFTIRQRITDTPIG